MHLREKLERVMGLQDEVDDDNAGGGTADDDKTVQPGPGETKQSIDDLQATSDDKGDKVDDDKKADEAKGDDNEADDKKAADDEPKGIPKSRLDAALKRAREAEAENRRLLAEQKADDKPAAKDDDDDDDVLTVAQAQKRVAELDGEIAKSIRDEDVTDEQVTALLREQRELQEGIREAENAEFQTETAARTAEEIQFDRVVTELEENIPALNPENKDEYNEDLVQETITLARALNAQGRSQADSMLLAVDYMSDKLGVKAGTIADVKKTTDVEKNVNTAKTMPPDVPGMQGASSDTGGITGEPGDAQRMSDAEFNALTQDEQKLRQLRGDML